MDNLLKYGFRPRLPRMGDLPKPERRRVVSGYSSAVAGTPDVNVGDPVSLVSDGTVAHTAAGGGAGAYGIVVGFTPYWNGSTLFQDNHLPAGTGTYGSNLSRQHFLLVIPVTWCYWECDADDVVTATTEAAYKAFIGENMDIAYSAASYKGGTGAFPRGDISTHNTTNTLQLRIEDISEAVENVDFSGANVKLVVSFNVVQQSPISATGV